MSAAFCARHMGRCVSVGLARAGQPIGGNDLLIAALDLALGCTIVTDNEAEFARIESLPRENWLRQA